MTKKFNEFKNRNIQKYINEARKELKAEGLLTDNEAANIIRTSARAYINFAAEICAQQIAKEYLKLYKKSIPKNKVK